jgi:hypothetical protein
MSRAMPNLRAGLRGVAAATALLAVAPAPSHAELIPFGSDLTAPANVTHARQADTAFWQTAFADGRSPLAPASGQIREFKVKGIALANPVAGVPGGETMFHLQAMRARSDGSFEILRTSQAFFMPEKGSDPQTITKFVPKDFCIDKGDVLVFNTVGGWDGIVTQTGPYPMGTPLQIFSSVGGAVVSEYTAADRTNNGDIVTPGTSKTQNNELLMRVTVGTDVDAVTHCPGGRISSSGNIVPPPGTGTPSTPKIQKATLPASQRVTVSKKGKLGVSMFCQPGSSARCTGRVRIFTRGARPRQIGSARFDVAVRRTGRATIFLTRTGRRLFTAKAGRLAVKITAETNPGGATRRSTLSTTLRRRGS